jgi:hypothetical protein
VIVSVCSDATGTTSLALTLGAAWPIERVVLEADPSGGDAVFWLHHADGQPLRPEPSALTLAADARGELPVDALPAYAQPTVLGVPVVVGAPSMGGYAPVERLWPRVAALAAGWPGTVIADLGRLVAHHPALPMLRASTVVLLQARADVAGLYRLRERVSELPAVLADPTMDTPPVAVVVRGPARGRRSAVGQVQRLLEAIGSPVPVAGFAPDDRRAVQALRSGGYTRRVCRTGLGRAAHRLAKSVLANWPMLSAPPVGPRVPDLETVAAAGLTAAPGQWPGPTGARGSR